MPQFRIILFTDSVRERRYGAAAVTRGFSFKRDSEEARATVLTEALAELKRHVPDGDNARCWVEIVPAKGATATIARFQRGQVLERFGPGPCHGMARRATWVHTETGETITAGES